MFELRPTGYITVSYGTETRACREEPHGEPSRHRDRGNGLLRPRHGDPPEAGGARRLRGARARLGRWRHLALQHLSGLRVRRPLAPLLLLLRPEPGVEPDLLAAAGDRRLPEALRRPVRHPPAHPP